MASRLIGSLGGLAARTSPASHATSVYRDAFTSAANNGDPVPATGSEEDKGRAATAGGGSSGRAEAGEKARGAAEEVNKEAAGCDVKDRAKETGEDVKEAIKGTR
ncbi:uncharacterized protein LOC120705231 [Panicum virgatum]|uniref:uncharacterized protein LOC120705231 n=1 Tax=Panicum virgatum TaxID=38727 RepID=UPI0019D62077|nr:uncharacterized protein LOC120705231 [Panicum virgatum]